MSETKWKSQLFSEEQNEKNKNILAFNMKNRIKKVKNKIDDIEPFETIYDKKEEGEKKEEGVDIDEGENVKEGMFTRGEFTGYDWDDPKHVGIGKHLGGSISDIIQKVYDYMVYIVKLTTDKVVEESGDSGRHLKKNKRVVRKYVGLFYCLPLALFATYNWYYITTFRNVLDDERTFPGKFLTQRTKIDPKTNKKVYKGLSDDFIEKCELGGVTGIVFNILYYFFEYAIKIFDEFNYGLLEYLPELITENLGRTITFLFLFFIILNLFYFSAEFVKDMFISLLTGEGLGVFSGILIAYIFFKIAGSAFGSEPNKHYFSDWKWVSSTLAPAGIAAVPIIGVFLVVNLLRALVVGSMTLFITPILIGLSVICYSFLAIGIFERNNFSNTLKEIEKECVKDYKVRATSYCKPYTLWDWLVFITFTLLKFLYDSLLSTCYIAMLVTAIVDYNSNIKGEGVKTNLILYSAAVLLLVLGIWFNKLASTTNKNLKEAGLLEKPKKFEFDETNVNINGEDLIQKINKDVEELNNATVKNIF